MVAVSFPVPWSADTINTSAASVRATATAISLTDLRIRSAIGPDCSLRIIMRANLRKPGCHFQRYERRATDRHSAQFRGRNSSRGGDGWTSGPGAGPSFLEPPHDASEDENDLGDDEHPEFLTCDVRN